MYSSILLAILAAGSSLVNAHGMIKHVKVGGKTYPGAAGPGSNPAHSPVRSVSAGDPIDDVNSSIMICGRDSKKAPLSAQVKPGDKVEVTWQGTTGINWFHNVGPVQTYMTSCNGDCSNFSPTRSTKWFKISALGLKPGGESWYQADMLDGSPLTVTIPAELPDGNYLFRQEVLALHNGMFKDRAEFFPNCIQMSVHGGRNTFAAVNPGPTATFPGAYKDTDPGILVNVYNPGFKYVMPGPPVANFGEGSSSRGNDNSSNDNPSSPAPVNVVPAPSDPPAPLNGGSSPKPSNPRQCKSRRGAVVRRAVKRGVASYAERRIVKVFI